MEIPEGGFVPEYDPKVLLLIDVTDLDPKPVKGWGYQDGGFIEGDFHPRKKQYLDKRAITEGQAARIRNAAGVPDLKEVLIEIFDL